MDAPSLTPERSRELADLRRRAYGPDADIQRDPEALSRLHELEALLRVDEAESAASPLVRTPTTQPAEAPAVIAGAAEPAVITGAPLPQQPAPRPWSRRVPLWVPLVAIGIIGIAAGLAAAPTLSPKPDVTLQRGGEMQLDLEDEWLMSISQWLTLDAVPVQYEAFHNLQVLSATSELGSSCLVVTWPSHWSDYSCTPRGLPPVVDFVAYIGGPQPLDGPVDAGTVIRFELRGDVVEVTMREPAEAPSPGRR